MVRLGIRDVLMQEVKSDDRRNAGRIILRTIDELLMRERAAQSQMSAGIDRALEKCGDLRRRAEAAGLAFAGHETRYETLLRLVAAWREAPDFVVRLILDDENGAPPAVAMQAARLATELENELDQAISAAATVPETAAEKERMLTSDELRDLLQSGLGEPEVKIEDFERIPGGLSKRTYRFTAAAPRWGEHPLIARETAKGSAAARAPPAMSMSMRHGVRRPGSPMRAKAT
jgi:hypothetical protein